MTAIEPGKGSFRPTSAPADDPERALGEAIREGLTSEQKWLPTALLYDPLGSALFEAITLLPEYEVARAGERLLTAGAPEIMAQGPWQLVELGPGGGRHAAELMSISKQRREQLRFIGIDVSERALSLSRHTLSALGGVEVQGVQASYLDGLRQVARSRQSSDRVPWLVLFLGSNLSNFERGTVPNFFASIRQALRPQDRFLLGVDLDKSEAQLVPAYSDALGVTAAFSRNVLLHLNRQWGANFPIAHFRHEARYHLTKRRIETYLVCTVPVTVRLGRLDLTVPFAAEEAILAETSHRFSVAELTEWGDQSGFRVTQHWVDQAWAYALMLYEAQAVRGHSV